MAIMKLTIGAGTGSLSLIASGLDSVFDSFTSLLSFTLLRMSLEPADKEHPYGHSRIESVAIFIQALFLTAVTIGLGYAATQRFDLKHEPQFTDATLYVAFACTVITLFLWIYLGRILEKTKSGIIAAERLHYFADLASNIIIFVGFLAARFLPIKNVDAILTLLLCLMILSSVYRIIVEAIKGLVDQHDPTTEEKIKTIIKRFHPEALGIARIRSRKSGRRTAVDLELLSCRLMRFQDVHDISHNVELQILEEMPTLDIIIHSEPCTVVHCADDKACQNLLFLNKR